MKEFNKPDRDYIETEEFERLPFRVRLAGIMANSYYSNTIATTLRKIVALRKEEDRLIDEFIERSINMITDLMRRQRHAKRSSVKSSNGGA